MYMNSEEQQHLKVVGINYNNASYCLASTSSNTLVTPISLYGCILVVGKATTCSYSTNKLARIVLIYIVSVIVST